MVGRIVDDQSGPRRPLESEVLRYFELLSNWGRWGADDTLGTLNFITPETRRRAAALVNEGIAVSCAFDIRPNQPSMNATLATPPQRYMAVTCDTPSFEGGRGAMAAEWFGMLFHGHDVTHVDALSHMSWDGQLYNGVHAGRVTPLRGATSHAITDAAAGIVGRGVLIDIPALTGRPWLEPGEGIFPEHLDAACARQGVTVFEGDIVLLHTGFALRRREAKFQEPMAEKGYPGWHAAALPWIHEHGVAAIGCDTPNDVRPSGYEQVSDPVHFVGIVAMGLWLIDNCDLTELAAVCSRLQRWTFGFILAGLRLRGGTGSPVNPIALL